MPINFRLPSKEDIKAKCTSLSAWELPKQQSSIAPEYVWTNKDMEPTPEEDQTWTMITWAAYWLTDLINLGTWETASSIIDVGLNWQQAIPILFVGTLCIGIPMVLNGAIGAHLHTPFSVIIRSSCGFYFAYFAIFSRCLLAIFWLGVQGAGGALAVSVMIGSIWPSFWEYDYDGPKNTLSESFGLSTMNMISYTIFWLVQLPLLLIPPTRLRYLFMVKIFAAPIAAIAMMGWCIHKAGGGGELFNTPTTLSGSTKIWKWLACMTSVTGSWSTLAVNIPDFSRYAKPSAAKHQYMQLPFLPIAFTLCGLLGIVTTSASYVIWGTYYWNPLDILEIWAKEYGSGGRAAAFFCALAWYIAQVGTNITANSISAANDLTVMFPKYVNIKRGCVIAAIIGGWVIVPWKIIASAAVFLNFMSGYSVFLAPLAGILLADYWLIKRRRYDIAGLYDPHGRYRYWNGINPWGLAAFIVGMTPNLPGLAASISTTPLSISAGAQHIYSIAWLYGFVSSITVYFILNKIWPLKAALIRDADSLTGVEVGEDKRNSSGNNSDNEVTKVPYEVKA